MSDIKEGIPIHIILQNAIQQLEEKMAIERAIRTHASLYEIMCFKQALELLKIAAFVKGI